MHSLIVAALLTLSKHHLFKEENRTVLSRYATKSFRTRVQRNSALTRTCAVKLRANERGKSSRKACAKTPPRSARRKEEQWLWRLVLWSLYLSLSLSLSLSFLTGHPGHLAFPACFFWLARYMAKCVVRFSIAGNLTNLKKIRQISIQRFK